MNRISRRQALLSTALGSGLLGLRALATGLPASFLLNPRRAFAEGNCPNPAKAQYIILSTSSQGDPIGANMPGTYGDPSIVHAGTSTTITVGGQQYEAMTPWASLSQATLDRTLFFHLATNTPVHPQEPDVLKLNGTSKNNEMLPSILARQLAPCLGTIQAQPISMASNPTEAISFQGEALPQIQPTALKATLIAAAGPLTNLAPLRDQTMNQLYALYKNEASPAQQAYIDSMVTSQQQLRSIKQSLLDALATINDDSPTSQVLAAVALIQMNISPVISVNIPFGSDNHSDVNLGFEAAQTTSGVSAITSLLQALAAANLSDRVTFMTLNVFGRSLGPGSENGRNHNPNHQGSLVIGKPFKGGVIGGLTPMPLQGQPDFGATSINSGTGAAGGDIAARDTLTAFAQTIISAVGGDPSVVQGGTAKVVSGALAS